MKNARSFYHGHRFPAAVISCAVRWYFRFQLSLRDIEELLFERGVIVSHETTRRCLYASRPSCVASPAPRGIWTKCSDVLRGEPSLLWRAVDRHGTELDILLQKRRDKAPAKRFFQARVGLVSGSAAQDRERPTP